MSIHHTLFACYANPLRVVDGADFSYATDYLIATTGLTGAADSGKGVFSGWFRFAQDGRLEILFSMRDASDTSFNVNRSSSGTIQVQGYNTSDSIILWLLSTSNYLASSTWIHILSSWDTATGDSHLYINDVDNLNENTNSAGNIDYTTGKASVGCMAAFAPSDVYDGGMAELYFSHGVYIDFSVERNRRMFISSTGKPVHLGIAGANPTGVSPLVYLHIDDGEAVANFATNRGTGGNFTITGTLSTGSTSPSD